MTQRLIRLTLYDAKISSVLDRLSKSRKQSMFVIEALRHFLGTENGQQLLQSFTAPSNSPPKVKVSPSHEIKSQPQQNTHTSNLDDIFM